MKLSEYDSTVGNWREQLRRNEVRTRAVIFTYILLFVAVGLLVDVYMRHKSVPYVSKGFLFHKLITFQIFPIATVIMAGIACVVLIITYALYDKIMLMGTDSREITLESAANLTEKQLYNVVEEMKVAAGLQFMPKVFIIEADYMNAFASGYSEKSAMVAITRGLMSKLDREELQAVMAHELSHIRHHDIKLTLTVAVLSNILLMVIDMLFYSVVFGRNDDKRQDNRLVVIIMILRYVLPLVTVFLTLFLNRTREYMADAGCVELMRNNEPLARALIKINADHLEHVEQYASDYRHTAHEQVRQASYLFDPTSINPVKSLSSAFSTHPGLDERLQAIGFKRKKQID
jgi:heat shock protein HtpX